MTFDRVIQDSDDEDDPLTELIPAPVKPPKQHQINGTSSNGTDTDNGDPRTPMNRARYQEVHETSNIGVNFDDFLHSQETAQTRVSASQQRREDRWIPAEVGGGSIGYMMTEIGLAQRRLFDDDAAAEDYVPPTDSFSAPVYDNGFGHEEQTDNFHVAVASDGRPEPGAYQNGEQQVHGNCLDHTRLAQHTNRSDYDATIPSTGVYVAVSSDDRTQSATSSYNIFDSSLKPSAYADAAHPSSIRSTDTVQPETFRKTPNRSKSMQLTPYSPHDTEPFSSVVTPKASRSRSDIAAQNQLQPPASSAHDELSAPVMIEIPAMKKKRGRKKKQAMLENEEDDELAQSIDSNEAPHQHDSTVPQQPKGGTLPLEQNGVDEASNDVVQNEPAKNDGFQIVVGVDVPQKNPLKREGKTAKEIKKTKLKRGKTTSVTVKRTYESDVEDDVIWVDERPSKANLECTELAPLPDPGTTDSKTTVPDEATDNDPNPTDSVQPNPDTAAPKKRGRKRKKTSDQLAAEKTPIEEAPEHAAQDESGPPPPDNNDQLTINETTLDDNDTTAPSPETPHKPDPNTTAVSTPATTSTTDKGPIKHSPISSGKVPYRVGLSRRARIAPLLKMVRR